MFSKLFKQIIRQKFITGVILLVVVSVGYFGYQRLAVDTIEVEYVTATAKRGTLVSAISGSGQVSVSDQVDVTPKVSGDVVVVNVKPGQEVKRGTLLVQLDSRDAGIGVRDAGTSLETSKLELDKLLEPPDELVLLQAKNSLLQTKELKQKSEDDLEKAYEDGFSEVTNTFLDLPTIMADLDDILYGDDMNNGQWNIDAYLNLGKNYDDKVVAYKNDVADSYKVARTKYDQNFQSYKAASRYSDSATIVALINETYETAKDISEAIKDTNNFIDFVKDLRIQRDLGLPSITATHQSSLETFTGKTNTIVSNLLSDRRTIQDSKEAIINTSRTIEEKELSLINLKDGADEFDIRAKRIEIQQRQDALLSARQTLADHFVRAPFDGVIAEVNASRGDSVSSGTTLITFITKQKIAEIALNEIDVAKIEIDQLATLTFDALEDVTLTGKVVEIDALGTVTQGVVTYNIKIIFDSQDDRIKSSMTIDASVVTERKDNVILVPNAAIQTQGGQIFAEVMQNGIPQQVLVELGLSNEVSTEIISGILEGDEVVTARLGGESNSQNSSGQSFRIPGLGGGGGFRGGGFQQH